VKFSDLGEFGFINRIARHYPIQPPYILKGIGDDAAVISFFDDEVILLTADQLIEGFIFASMQPGERSGRESLGCQPE
jgi:thiamine-monophosphate kinase